MFMLKKLLHLVCLMLVICLGETYAQGILKGTVKDSITRESLPGANILVEGTRKGTITNEEGKFTMTNLPEGEVIVKVSFIGYMPETHKLSIQAGEITSIEAYLKPSTIGMEEVIVSVQAKGQISAINEQRASNNITNVVSGSKVQELPEANAAEAVGRLPGVSIKRSGGEGNKIVVRGLSPKYNNIQLDGVTMAATGESDRSVDLSMISSYMLSGIEVTKSAMADQEANQLGGTVNFRLKEAPDEFKFDVMAQGGYNQLRNAYGDYKVVAGGSNRFFNNSLGVFAQANLEQRNRSDQTVNVGYNWYSKSSDNTEKAGYPYTGSVNVSDVSRGIQRQNGTLVLDYKNNSTKIISSNFYSRKITDLTVLGESHNPLSSDRIHSYSYMNQEENLNAIINKLRIEQVFSNLKISASGNYSRSETDVPDRFEIGADFKNAYGNWVPSNDFGGIAPETFVKKADEFTKGNGQMQFFDYDNYNTIEENLGLKFDMNYEIALGASIDLDVQLGGQYTRKNKNYDYNAYFFADYGDLYNARNVFMNYFKKKYNTDFTGYAVNEDFFPFYPFIDQEYNPGEFLKGDFIINQVFDKDVTRDFMAFARDTLQSMGDGYYYNIHNSNMDDYFGHEEYYAAYVMPTLNIGRKLTFIPGFRYEKNRTEYTALHGSTATDSRQSYPSDTITRVRENEFILPMVHLKYDMKEWLSIQAAYTKTLSRPSYTQFIPKIIRHPLSGEIEYRNPFLEPARSNNLDLRFSMYGSKAGLFTVSGFYKSIEDLIFYKEVTLIDSSTIEKYNIDMKPDPTVLGNKIQAFFNNPNETEVYGIEVEYQSNFWYLPGLLSGLVFNINYTRAFSKANYPKGIPKWGVDTVDTPFGTEYHKTIVGTIDSSYTARMIDQPNHILNISLGYDYKGFSLRLSMQYNSDIFVMNHFHEELRAHSAPLTLWDLKVKQELPLEGLRLFCNLKNLTSPIETDINDGTGFFSNKHYYGMTADVGLRYTF